MSYVHKRVQRMKKRPRGHRGFAGLGDDSSAVGPNGLPQYCSVFDDNYFQLPGVPGTNGVPDYATALATCSPTLTSGCSQQAGADAAKFAATAADLRNNWNPGGDDYRPDDLWKVVQQVVQFQIAATPIINAPIGNIGTSDDARDVIKMFTDAIGDLQTQMLNYKSAYQAAKASGAKAVHAPGLKDWVTSSLDTFAQAVFHGSSIACNEPWWSGPLQTLFAVASTVGSVCKSVAAIALAVGEKAVTAVEGGLDMIAMIEKIAPFAAVGLAAWWLFLREKKRGEKVFAL